MGKEEEKEMVGDMGKDTEGTKTGHTEKEEEHNNEETDGSEMEVSSDEDSDTTIN